MVQGKKQYDGYLKNNRSKICMDNIIFTIEKKYFIESNKKNI